MGISVSTSHCRAIGITLTAAVDDDDGLVHNDRFQALRAWDQLIDNIVSSEQEQIKIILRITALCCYSSLFLRWLVFQMPKWQKPAIIEDIKAALSAARNKGDGLHGYNRSVAAC